VVSNPITPIASLFPVEGLNQSQKPVKHRRPFDVHGQNYDSKKLATACFKFRVEAS